MTKKELKQLAQKFSVKCPDCDVVARGKTEKSASQGLTHHRMLKHDYYTPTFAGRPKAKLVKGSLLHYLHHAKNTDMSEALAIWASSPKKQAS